jgi:HNH endonuclease
VSARFWSKVDVRGPDECWPWLGARVRKGYGSFYVGGHMLGAHRWIYEQIHGPIAEGMQIDHTCHNTDQRCSGDACVHRRCCNPAHLEQATSRENGMRGRTLQAAKAAQTECIHGHPFDEANTIIRTDRPGTRECRRCAADAARRYRQRKKVLP